MNKTKIYLVVPAYNEEERIGAVIKQIKRYKFPIIVMDDGSTDDTYLVSKKAGADHVLRHKVNLGKGAALKSGCDAAFKLGADAVVLVDSDGQHEAGDLPKFIEKLDSEKYDIIFGSRSLGHGVPLIRFLGNKFGSVLISFMFDIYVSDILCGFRAFTKKAYRKINWESIRYGVETEMVVRAGKKNLKYCEVPVATVYLDKYKGVTILDAIGIFFDVIRWKIQP